MIPYLKHWELSAAEVRDYRRNLGHRVRTQLLSVGFEESGFHYGAPEELFVLGPCSIAYGHRKVETFSKTSFHSTSAKSDSGKCKPTSTLSDETLLYLFGPYALTPYDFHHSIRSQTDVLSAAWIRVVGDQWVAGNTKVKNSGWCDWASGWESTCKCDFKGMNYTVKAKIEYDYIKTDEVYDGVLLVNAYGAYQLHDRGLIYFDPFTLNSWTQHNENARLLASTVDIFRTKGLVENLENVISSEFSTRIVGDKKNNVVDALGTRVTADLLDGDDLLLGGNFDVLAHLGNGTDNAQLTNGLYYLDGGSGYDTASYSGRTAPLTLNLQNKFLPRGDVLKNFEYIQGTNNTVPSYILGDNTNMSYLLLGHNNRFYGRSGSDLVIPEAKGSSVVRLRSGKNRMILPSGQHRLHCGINGDQIILSGSSNMGEGIEYTLSCPDWPRLADEQRPVSVIRWGLYDICAEPDSAHHNNLPFCLADR